MDCQRSDLLMTMKKKSNTVLNISKVLEVRYSHLDHWELHMYNQVLKTQKR